MRFTKIFGWLALTVVLSGYFAGAAAAPVPVPETISSLEGVREDEHVVLAADGGAPLGVQRLRAWRNGEILHLELDRRFANGERSREEATARINGILEPLEFHKKGIQDGEAESQDMDFRTGIVKATIKGETRQYELDLPPDTYVGPLLAVASAQVTADPTRFGEFSTVALTPEPKVYRLRAEVVERGAVDLGAGLQRAYEVRLRPDLGAVKNVLFASFLPAHHFWFADDPSRQFLAFRGTLGYEGQAVRIVRSADPGEKKGDAR